MKKPSFEIKKFGVTKYGEKAKKFILKGAGAVGLFAFAASAAVGPWDADVSDFPRTAGETGDSARIMRAVAKAGRLIWRDNQPLNFTPAEMKDLNDELKKQGASDRAANSSSTAVRRTDRAHSSSAAASTARASASPTRA